MTSPFELYLKKIEADLRRGNATEYTYRGSFENFIESFGKGIDASNDPKHIACGAPDFIIEKGKVPLGYIETKDIGEDLDRVERSDQMKRYLKALNNVILTDYLEFRWFVNGEKKRTLHIAAVDKNRRVIPNPLSETNVAQLFADFFATETPTVNTPKELATRLAGVTKFIREQIVGALASGDPDIQKSLQQRFAAFKELLLPALKPQEFADLYAQAMTYGLFAAKLSAPEGQPFTLAGAYQSLFGSKFLRRLFSDVSEELDDIAIIRPYLQDIVSLLNRADFQSILADFGHRTRTEDPVVHFYETFLAAYDPKLRESRGVYYTPEPVVQFIVRAVDDVLKTRFDKPWGLADDSVKVLDPAAGTGTFLYYVIQQIHDEVVKTRGQAGMWAQKSKTLLKRLFGFELLIAPYVVSHLNLGLLLKELGTPLEGHDERLQVYLTNTLEEGVTRAEQLAGMSSYIAEESSEAARVKKAEDIMVVLGNPPYSNFGMMNQGKWISELLEEYKKGLQEKKINLDDDYIKFIRYGQEKIEKTGKGILALITNNSFIDGITHRQMRNSLLNTFSEIYILNLHGNVMRREKTPDGSIDNNVFDIQQGVSINIFIKIEKKKNQKAKVFYSDLFGSRESKYKELSSSKFCDVKYVELLDVYKRSCLGDFRFFTPFETENIEEYCQAWSIPKIFTINQNGIKTDRDDLFFEFDKKTLIDRMKIFYSEKAFENSFVQHYRIQNSSSYDLLSKRNKSTYEESLIINTVYRPFDNRWLYYSPTITSRPAFSVMKHIVGRKNLGLIFMRQVSVNDLAYSHFFVSDLSVESRAFYSNKGIMSFAPLYTYDESISINQFALDFPNLRVPNINIEFINACSAKLALQFIPDGQGDLNTTFGPEDVFYYAYAVFHSPTYRSRYAEFLKIDFPRLPLTGDKKLFAKLVKLGKELVDLHLLRTPRVDDFITTYPVAGENRVEKVVYTGGRVNINSAQYFSGVPVEVWQFKIGGYQVCDKWLKDRKGRLLTGEDITHYQRVVVALKETIRLMAEIDSAIPKWPLE